MGEKIQDLPEFHNKISKLAIRPPLEELTFISANQQNNQMIGRIKIGDRDAVINFRQVDGIWLIDSPMHWAWLLVKRLKPPAQESPNID